MQANWALLRWFPGLDDSSLRELKVFAFTPSGVLIHQDNDKAPGGGGESDRHRNAHQPPSASSHGARDSWGARARRRMSVMLRCTALLCQVPQERVLTLASVI